ncbi:iron chelate uptake ABC transporter family permease subunit [Candidatus Bathyarchaeota archaeon A05DMB-2]|nr:iron chelate uptake ABC transporter family permease subunit [Candidatus Bathyarchaeota archaeon A05DMB-2]
MNHDEVESAYFRRTSRWKLIILLLIVALIVTVIVSLNVGYAPIPFPNILAILAKQVPFLNNFVDSSLALPRDSAIILQIRLPRIMAGIVVGAALSSSGVVYQGVFKNPMADSYLLGVSSGAAVGASLSLLLGAGFSLLGLGLVQVAAFFGALFAMFLVYNIARVGPKVPITMLLLCGLAVNFFMYSIVSLLEVLAGDTLHSIVFWLIGGFSNVLWSQIWAVLPFIIVGTITSYFYVRDLNLLALGEETAHNLGVNVEKVKTKLLVSASMVAAAAVSLSGLIGFVGLMVPHITRLVIGPDHRILFPTSIITGAIFLVVCDAVARVIATPFASTLELPVGIITMLAGAPFFVILLKKKKQSYAL